MLSTYGWEKKNDIPSITRAYQSPGTAVTRLIGRRMIHVVAAVLFLGIFVTALNVYELRGMQDGSRGLQHRESSVQEGEREKGIKNEPIEVVRERRELYKQDEDQVEEPDLHRTPTDNRVPNNEIDMADKGATADSSQQTKEV
ncbi:uncharacterized protein LOC144912860 [Branchiostoma floridae x Branchiostoma belcheri]